MANILTTIITWEIFQALATVLIFISLTKILKKWTKNDSEKKEQIKKGFTVLVIMMILFTILSGFYRVSTSENVVLTKLNGNKIIVEDVGIKYSLLGSVEKIDLRQQTMFYPDRETFLEADIIVTKDEKVIKVSGVCEYEIVNTTSWAIKNKNSENQLYYYLNSLVTGQIKSNDYFDIMNERKEIENKIKIDLEEVETKYGINILDFYFVKTTDEKIVLDAKSNAEASKITSESTIQSSQSESEALITLYNSISDKDFIRYIELIKAIKEGKVNTIVIPEEGNFLISN